MKAMQWTVILVLLASEGALADNQSDRQKLIGSWEGTNGSNSVSSWTFSTTPSAIKVTQMDGNNKVADFSCGTDGTSCEVKIAGKKAMVSIWFNGPRLVEMETKGSDVLKRRFAILPKDDVMEMEVIPIVPGGKTETSQFKRVRLSARDK